MYSKKVKDFARACGDIAPHPQLFSPQQIDFLAEMVRDEFDEFKEAKDVVEQADALVDILYYVVHAAAKHGYDLDPVFDIVHEANMKKVVNGKVIKRKDGKIMKPEGWESPEPLIAKEIARQINSGDGASLQGTNR